MKSLQEKFQMNKKNKKLKPKLFIQVNIGNESQKNGIQVNKLGEFYNYCKELNLNIVGLCVYLP